jgi:lysophospholipase L1-like esterase
MLRWNHPLFTEYLTRRDPALIVLAYGSNEAGTSAEGYVDLFEQVLDTLHRDAPNAAILVLGPYDRQIAHVTLTGRGRRKRRSASWTPLSGVDRIISAQREACRTHACSFYDARRRMGGPGSLPRWIAAGWAQPDHTHLTATGYRALADALYTDLQHLDPTPPTK